MGATIHTFPGAGAPAEISAASHAVLKAIELLEAVRAYTPRHPLHSEAEHEVEVLGRAIGCLQRGRPLPGERPDAHAIALMDEALVLAELCGQALHQLDEVRRPPTTAVAMEALLDALANGPEVNTVPFPEIRR